MKKVLTPSYIRGIVQDNGVIKDISIKNRKQEYTYSRYVYFKLCKSFSDIAKFSYREIGDELKLDHSTSMKGIDVFDDIYNQQTFQYHKKLFDFCFNRIVNDFNNEKYKIGCKFDELRLIVQNLSFEEYETLHKEILDFIELKKTTVSLTY